jgi:hypothetical protein
MDKSLMNLYGVWLCYSAIDIFNFLGPHNENVLMGESPNREEKSAKSPNREEERAKSPNREEEKVKSSTREGKSPKSPTGEGESSKSPEREENDLNEVNVEPRELHPHTSSGAEGLSIEEKEQIMIARIGEKYLKKYFNHRDFLMWF